MAKPPIQAAINVAEPSHRVLVSTGGCETGGRVASGLARINRVVINKPIAMQSANRSAVTTIRGSGPRGDGAVRCVWMTNGATLVGLTLTNDATRITGDPVNEQSGGGVWAQSTRAVVSNCTRSGHASSSFGGGAANCTLNHCTLTGNSAGFSGGGDRFGTLQNCTVNFNNAPNEPNTSGGEVTASCTTPAPGGAGHITNDPQFVSLATTNHFVSIANATAVAVGDNLDFTAENINRTARSKVNVEALSDVIIKGIKINEN